MNKRIVRSALIIMAAAWLLNPHSAYCVDELYLTGIVKTVDVNLRTAVVDVQSSSCRGVRTFAVDQPYELTDSIAKKIDFSIDSSRCTDGRTYKMFLRGRKWR